MYSPGLKVTCGFASGLVFLATLTSGALPAHAASSDPLTPPAGWSGTSDSGHWDYNQMQVLGWNMHDADGVPLNAYDDRFNQEGLTPEDSLFIDLFHSGASVREVGDTTDFLIAFRQAPSPFNPFPDEFPGAQLDQEGYPGVVGFSVSLQGLVDDVEELTLDDFTVEGTPPESLTFSNGVLGGSVRMTDGVSDTRIRFTSTYTGAGDDVLAVRAGAYQAYRYYGAAVDATVTVPVAPVEFDVFKSSSVSEVTSGGDEIAYTVKVNRKSGANPSSLTLKDDMSDVLKDALPFSESDFTLPAGFSGNPAVTKTGFTLTGEWPRTDGRPADSFSVTYKVRYDGESTDDALVNSVCVSGPHQDVVDDCAEASVTVGEPAAVVTSTTSSVAPPIGPSASTTSPDRPTSSSATAVQSTSPSGTAENSATPGAETESTPTLSKTGADISSALLWAGGAAVALGGALVAAVTRRGARRH